jgi:hypothetical protein
MLTLSEHVERLLQIAYNPTADAMSWFALRGFLLDVFGFINPQNQYTAGNFLADYQTEFTAYASPTQNPPGEGAAPLQAQSLPVTGAGR